MPAAKYPRIVEKENQKMAVVTGVGAPDEVFEALMPALFGSVYTLKFDLKKRTGETFKVGKIVARWPDAHLKPKGRWTAIIGLPIPGDVAALPQKVPGTEVKIETWKYGTVAEIIHKGAYSEEGPTIEALLKFIDEQGYKVAGSHEEEYLTMPDTKSPKTLIRYPVMKK